jgi:hypothetical protein
MTVEKGTPKVAAISRQLLPSARSRTAWSRPKYPLGPPEPFTAPLRRTNAGHDALPDEFPLEFRECREDVEEEPGCGVALVCVDVLGNREEPNAQADGWPWRHSSPCPRTRRRCPSRGWRGTGTRAISASGGLIRA